MMRVDPCPVCGADVIHCDNAVFLDYPAVAYDAIDAPWTLMRMGARMVFGSVGDPSPTGQGHTLHEHQPEGSVMA